MHRSSTRDQSQIKRQTTENAMVTLQAQLQLEVDLGPQCTRRRGLLGAFDPISAWPHLSNQQTSWFTRGVAGCILQIEDRLPEEAFMYKRRFPIAVILALIVGVYAAAKLSAQQSAAPNEGSAPGVPAHIVVTVEPRHGDSAPVVNREDVMVYEDHDRDAVTDWIAAQGDHAALELFVLLDDSSSSNLGTQLEDIRQFMNGQPASTKIGVAYMQNGTARIAQSLTGDHALAAKALRLPMGIAGGNASPYFSLSDLIKHWPATTARRAVLMVTDGIDRYYGTGDLADPYLDKAIDDALRAGVMVSAIYNPDAGHYGHDYWQSYWGQIYLAKVADETGGEAYYIGFNGPAVAFAPYLTTMAGRLEHQYLLTFLAKRPKKAGFQRIHVTTEVPNVDLVSPSRVWVSPKE
jgi:hypothetical protein